MNYIYIISYVCAVTTYRTERYKHLHGHALFFLNFNIEYSIFYTPQNILFSKIMLYPPFYCASVYLHITYYNIRS